MNHKQTQLEFVLDKLREIAVVNPSSLPIYIAEANALLQIADSKFNEQDIKWFNEEIDKIIQIYLGGELYTDEYYQTDRQILM